MKYTKDILAILIVFGTLVSLFIPTVNSAANQILQTLSSLIIGFYFGTNKDSIVTMFKNKK